MYLPLILLALVVCATGGPISWGACQSACNYGAVVCYSAAGLTFGVTAAGGAVAGPVGWWAWLTSVPTSTVAAAAACSAAQGACMAACTPLMVAPTP